MKNTGDARKEASLGDMPQGRGGEPLTPDTFDEPRRGMEEKAAEGAGKLEGGNALILLLADSLRLGLVAVDRERKEILFENQRARAMLYVDLPACEGCPDKGKLVRAITGAQAPEVGAPEVWDLICDRGQIHYQTSSHAVEWGGKPALVHFLEEALPERRRESALMRPLYQDALTGIANRRHCEERLEEYIASRTAFALCCFSLKNLENVKEQRGETEADAYILHLVKHIQGAIRTDDFFGRYQDNAFLVVLRGVSSQAMEKKFAIIDEALRRESGGKRRYEMGIRYGVTEAAPGQGSTAQALAADACARMKESDREGT